MAIEERPSIGMRLCDYVRRLTMTGVKSVKIDRGKNGEWNVVSTGLPKTAISRSLDKALVLLLQKLEIEMVSTMMHESAPKSPKYLRHLMGEHGEYWHLWEAADGSVVGLPSHKFPEGFSGPVMVRDPHYPERVLMCELPDNYWDDLFVKQPPSQVIAPPEEK